MLILLLLIMIISFVCIGVFVDWELGFWITSIPIIVLTSSLIFCGVCYTDIITIDDQIALYEEENAEIEQEISAIVESYKEYESETFKEISESMDPLVIYSVYPDLKSNKLFEDQINLYCSNNDEIKALKSKKINLRELGWWIHFNIF